jgi:hypothetical protein
MQRQGRRGDATQGRGLENGGMRGGGSRSRATFYAGAGCGAGTAGEGGKDGLPSWRLALEDWRRAARDSLVRGGIGVCLRKRLKRTR